MSQRVKEVFSNIQTAMKNAHSVNWKDTAFSKEKAHLAALYAQLAYASIPEFELGQSHRVKIVPSDLYALMISDTGRCDFSDLVQGMSLEGFEIFSVSNLGAVAVGVKTSEVIFVAIRGTVSLYDAAIDLRAWRFSPYKDRRAKFHKGFYSTIADLRWPLISALQKWRCSLPVVITGHSLGGAMAAILTSMEEFHYHYWYHHNDALSCFTFGMPRYGNTAANIESRYPYHIYNQDDLVPRFPPAFLGYPGTEAHEYCLQTGLVPGLRPSSQSIFSCRLSQHRMEAYLQNLNGITKLLGKP